jgi:hypothetical protein
VIAAHQISARAAVRTVGATLGIDAVVTSRQTLRVLAERAVDTTFTSDALHASFVLGSGISGLKKLAQFSFELGFVHEIGWFVESERPLTLRRN